jgi:nicotinamide-nucleotide amidase
MALSADAQTHRLPGLSSSCQSLAEISDRYGLLLGLSLGFALMRRGGRLMAAESCTGGLVSHWTTAIGGSSQWFDGAVVSYANAAKTALLGVDPESITTHGAVSPRVARQMADGLRTRHQLLLHNPELPCYSLAVTGVAGPQGGRPDKPVGTVWFGWAGPSGTETEVRLFAGSRGQIQRQAAAWAMAGLFSRLCRAAPI